jgi:hypothetical protein
VISPLFAIPGGCRRCRRNSSGCRISPLGPRAHALDDLAAEGFDGAIELGDMTRDQRTERAAVAGTLSASSPPWFFTSSS